jgi:hypothetical protein
MILNMSNPVPMLFLEVDSLAKKACQDDRLMNSTEGERGADRSLEQRRAIGKLKD